MRPAVPFSVIWTGTSSVTLPLLANVNVTDTEVPGKSTLFRRMSSTWSVSLMPSDSAWLGSASSEMDAGGAAALLLADAEALADDELLPEVRGAV